jgi:ribosomal protein S10
VSAMLRGLARLGSAQALRRPLAAPFPRLLRPCSSFAADSAPKYETDSAIKPGHDPDPNKDYAPEEYPSTRLPPLESYTKPANQQSRKEERKKMREESVLLAQLNLRGNIHVFLEDCCKDVLRSADHMGIATSGIIRLPTRRNLISVLRSPFVNKGAQDQASTRPAPLHRHTAPRAHARPEHTRAAEDPTLPLARAQFETRNHARLIEIYGDGPTKHDGTKVVNFLRYFEHTILPAHGGAVSARIMLVSDEKLRIDE